MKSLIYMAIILNTSLAHTSETEKLADSIAQVCDFDSNKTEDEKMSCGENLTNCIIQLGGKWEEKDIFRCMKKYYKGDL